MCKFPIGNIVMVLGNFKGGLENLAPELSTEALVGAVKMGRSPPLLCALPTHSPAWLSLQPLLASSPCGELDVWSCPAAKLSVVNYPT